MLAAPAAALAAVLGVTAAFAATTWTVQPGGAVIAKSGRVIFKDATTGGLIVCPHSTIKATLRSGPGLPGGGIGDVSSFTFPPPTPPAKACTGPLDFTFALKITHLPLTLNATSYNASTGPSPARNGARR